MPNLWKGMWKTMKNGIKRLLSTFLVLCLLGSLVGAAGIAAAETGSYSTCGEGFVWQFDEETGVLTIQGSGPMYDFEDEMALPWSQYLKQIKKVVVLHGVTSIGKNAFAGCMALEEISLPETVTDIGSGAFRECESLQEVDLSATALTELKADTFAGCTALTKVSLPATVQSVEAGAFAGVQNLETIVCHGEEEQVKKLLKDVELGQTEVIIVPNAEPENGEPMSAEPAPAVSEPTQPVPVEPAPTESVPTEPTVTEPVVVEPTEPEPVEPEEVTRVYYKEGGKITEVWKGDRLLSSKEERHGRIVSTSTWTYKENGGRIQITEYSYGARYEREEDQHGRPSSEQNIDVDGKVISTGTWS